MERKEISPGVFAVQYEPEDHVVYSMLIKTENKLIDIRAWRLMRDCHESSRSQIILDQAVNELWEKEKIKHIEFSKR